ncbi:MAG: VacJ family lipoprotein [Candidatus Tectomicrobia bacterium]|uniref:VacJ family lipoprotein n=1 Tax=Tectimicrobiota bacterium TaxID=2528274 RepID=A0A932I2L2_UNCTE|nr:VacJ family lipoprotein [Candidatus Tectomicrobia bacterium]
MELSRKASCLARVCLAAWLAVSSAGLAGCAAQQSADAPPGMEDEVPDPLEELNRAVFEFNDYLDIYILRPLALGYRAVLPQPVRDSVRNFLRNLGAPVTFFNDVLQGKGERAQITLGRFMVNTTFGVVGLFDVADGMGAPYHSEDFGQTLAVWGAKPGIYLVLPILGPSTTRDAAGRVADVFMNPFNYVYAHNDLDYLPYVFYGVGAVDLRERNLELLDQLKAEALDYYTLIRSIYLQIRENEIQDGKAPAGGPGGKLQTQ